MIRFTACLVLAAVFGAAPAETPSTRLEVASALIRVIEQVDVPAREAGMLVAVQAREGQIVEQGDPLARILDTEVRLAAARAEMEVEVARKNAENDVNIRFAKKSAEVAKAELRRSLDSIAQYPKSISDTEMDRLRLIVERAVLEVEQAERDFEIAKLTRQIKENELQFAQQKVERRKIVAPLSGVVVQVNRRRGEWVKPGDTVLRILRIDRLRAEGFLKVRDISDDLEGCPVTLAVDLPGRPGAEFPGKVVFVSPEIDPVNAQIRVWAEMENRGLLLRPGMRAKMTIQVPSDTPAPKR
jgi:multidrug efflux pump subunit AcrA (membrane-fusion protein)